MHGSLATVSSPLNTVVLSELEYPLMFQRADLPSKPPSSPGSFDVKQHCSGLKRGKISVKVLLFSFLHNVCVYLKVMVESGYMILSLSESYRKQMHT